MSRHYFWLSDAQFARLQPLLPNKLHGVLRVDDRRVISGIVYVIRHGLIWRDAPEVYRPHKMLYNRFVRWSLAGMFDRFFDNLAATCLLKKALSPSYQTHQRCLSPRLHVVCDGAARFTGRRASHCL